MLVDDAGPGPLCGEASSTLLFTEVLHHVPRILDLVPAGTAYSVACTCWPALLTLLQYGRRIEEGECEWTRHVYINEYQVNYNEERHHIGCSIPFSYELDLKSEQRTVPVLRLGNIALLQGLALRVSAGSQYVGELEYAGARVPVQDAAALLAAVVAAGVSVASMPTHNVGELAAVLEASERPGAARLRVTSLAVQRNLLSSDTVAPDVLEERVSSLCRVLSTPAVREHARHIDMARVKMSETAAAEVLGALSTGHALETLDIRGNNTLGLTGAHALVNIMRTSTKLRELDLYGVNLSPRGATIVAEAVLETKHIRKLVVSQHIDGVVDELARHGGGGLETLRLYCPIPAESAGKLAACATNLLDLQFDEFHPDWTDATMIAGFVKQLVQPGSLLRCLNLQLPYDDSDVVVRALCAAVANNPSSRLESLELIGSLGHDGAEAIATLLASCTTLRALILWGNVLPDAGYVHITEALAQNTTLRELTIDSADITTADAFAKLARAVASSRLEVLNMPRTTFPTDTTINIADLSRSSTLRSISIGFGDEGMWDADGVEQGEGSQRLAGVRDFAAGLAHNNVLRILVLDGFAGFAEPDAIEALADALRTNTALRTLSIPEVEFECDPGEAVRALAQALRHNRGLRCVELFDYYDEDTGDDAKQMMVQALKENTTLQRLHLGDLLCDRTRYGNGGAWSDTIENVPGRFPRIVLHDTT